MMLENKMINPLPHNPEFNPFPNKPWFLRVCCTSLLKTLREKEKLLVKSNFSFSRSVFYPLGELSSISIEFKIVIYKLFRFGRVLNLSFGKGLTAPKEKAFKNIVGKGENAGNHHFLL